MRTQLLVCSLLLGACGGGTPAAESAEEVDLDSLGPFRLGMSAVDLRVACADAGGSDWSPNRHAFTRGCELSVDVHGVSFQRFEMRLDGPAGRLVRIRGHAEGADLALVQARFADASLMDMGEIIVVTIESEPDTDTDSDAQAALPGD